MNPENMMVWTIISIAVSVLALAMSVASFQFARRSWRETYRPIVTARVVTESAGNIATLYNLVVDNTGNRPATDIRLHVDQRALTAAFKSGSAADMAEITNCFDPHYTIPVLANGRSVSTAFGQTTDSSEGNWIPESRFPIRISYRDLNGKGYSADLNLFIFDTGGFAGFQYGSSS